MLPPGTREGGSCFDPTPARAARIQAVRHEDPTQPSRPAPRVEWLPGQMRPVRGFPWTGAGVGGHLRRPVYDQTGKFDASKRPQNASRARVAPMSC